MREGSGNRTSEGRDRVRGDCESTPGRERPRQREQRREIELHRAPRPERRQTSADGSPLERPISENDSPTLPGQRRASSWKAWTEVHAQQASNPSPSSAPARVRSKPPPPQHIPPTKPQKTARNGTAPRRGVNLQVCRASIRRGVADPGAPCRQKSGETARAKQTDESVCGKRGRSRHVAGALHFGLPPPLSHTDLPAQRLQMSPHNLGIRVIIPQELLKNPKSALEVGPRPR